MILPDLQGLPGWSWGEFHTFLWSLWSWACIRCPPSHQSPQTAVWSPSSCLCHVCLRLSFFSCTIQWKKKKPFKRFKDHDTMNEWTHASKLYAFLIRLTLLSSPPASEVWFSGSCLPFLFHPVCRQETAPLRWAHLCGCGRSEIGPLATPSWSSVERKQTLTTGSSLCFKSQWTAYLDGICKHHKPDRALCASILLKDYFIQK